MIWRQMIGKIRMDAHDQWVAQVLALQNMLPANYHPPVEPREASWEFKENNGPRVTIFIKRIPELNEIELNKLILTWGGLLWMGNPFVLSICYMYNDNENFGGLNRGTAVIRLASEELANEFLRSSMA